MTPEATGVLLTQAREEASLTQVELAARLGVAQVTISSWEHGRRQPSLQTLGRIADVLGITLAELLGLKAA